VTQESLEREHIAAVAQILDRERMAKPMWMDPLHPCSLTKPLHPL
jgi:hypothetical protein